MPPKNIATFNILATHFLITLYERFPGQIDFKPSDAALEAFPGEESEDKRLELASTAMDTFSWLADYSFIDVAGTDLHGSFFGVRLSNKALAILGAPDAIEDGETLAESLQSALRNGSADTLNAGILKLIALAE